LVLHGGCQQDALIPFEAFVEAVRPLVYDPGDWLRLAIENGTADSRLARYQRFEEFERVLTARRQPVVFVLDEILRHILLRDDRLALLVVATARPEALDPRHALATVLSAAQSAHALEVIELAGLTLPEAEDLAEGCGVVDAERTRVAWQRTGGNLAPGRPDGGGCHWPGVPA
jgi:hypothetical protein